VLPVPPHHLSVGAQEGAVHAVAVQAKGRVFKETPQSSGVTQV
jgi:hypothetical protein